MGGLLYKDFVSVNNLGKFKMTWIMVIVMIAFITLRILFPGTADFEEFILIGENGETVSFLDILFMMGFAGVLISLLLQISAGKIMEKDVKGKINDYISTMPFDKKTYIASKYIFIGIEAYVIMSITFILGTTCTAFCREGHIQDQSDMLCSLIIPMTGLVLIFASIEFPLIISLGKEAATRVTTVLWTIVAFIALGYLMFGDLKVFENININSLLDYIDEHKIGIMIFESVCPAIVLVLYYLSYRLSSFLYNRKGDN